jgi:hypothetical protein
MALFRKSHKAPPLPVDTAEIELAKIHTKRTLDEVNLRGLVINQVSGNLAKRRRANHFGETLEISFTPRGNHA